MEIEELLIDVKEQQLAVVAVNTHVNNTPLIFIHGVLASVNFWKSVIPNEILDSHPWYSVSLPGHYPSTLPQGFSPTDIDEDWMADVYEVAIEKLIGDKDYILVGHSTGGFAALNLGARQPEKLKGIVSIAGFYNGDWGGIEGMLVKIASWGRWAKPLFVANLALGRSLRGLQETLSSLLAHDRVAYKNSPRTQKMLGDIQKNIQAQTLSHLFPLFNRISTFDIRHKLSNIQLPVWLFVGTHDPVIHAQQSLVLADAIPNAETIIFEDTGHMPFMEKTAEFNRQFLLAISHINQDRTESSEVLHAV